MPTVVVHHDQPIAEALEGTRDQLTVVEADGPEAVLEQLPSAEMLVVNPANWRDEYLDALGAGDWVQATSTGYAAFPVDRFEARGIAFSNAWGNYGHPVADHAFALLLALARGVPKFVDRQREHDWDRDLGTDLIDLQGRTLTIAGLGDIGEQIAHRGLAFGMSVRGTKGDPSAYAGILDGDRVHPAASFRELLPETDVLVLVVPLTEETHHLLDREALRSLPRSAIVVNVARGPVIDETALVAALEDGEIAGAGLDVFESEPLEPSSPLWDRDDVVITPHVGGRSRAFVDRFVDLFLENVDRRTRGEPLRNEIVPGDGA